VAKPKDVVVDAANEQVLIRAAIADADSRRALVHGVSASEFLFPAHGAIWRALRALSDRGLEYSDETMGLLLAAEGFEDGDYFEEVAADAGVAPNLAYHVETVRWDATRARTLEGPVPELLKELSDGRAGPDRVVAAARAVLQAVQGGGGRRHMRRGEELERAYLADLRARMEKRPRWLTGFSALDERLAEGAMPGRFALITGLPGSGKSTFVVNLVINLAKQGRRVLFCPWEMGSENILDLMACALTGTDVQRVIRGELSAEEARQIQRATRWLVSRVKFMDNAFFDLRSQRERWERGNDRCLDLFEGYLAESGCDACVCDLYERMLIDTSPDGIMSALTRQQAMWREYGVFGVGVQQLTLKDVERRTDKRPTRDAIKGSAGYVEIPDLIFGCHRDAQFKAVDDDKFEVICLKQRKGASANWAVQFEWQPSVSRITGGVEVAYNPGLEQVMEEHGDVRSVSSIKTGRKKLARRERRD